MERVILKPMDFNKLKIAVRNNRGKEIIFSSKDDELNRKVLEKLDVSGILISLEGRKDYMKQRNSGFNQVMAKIAKKNNIFIGINFDELVNSKEKNKIISRLKQNIFLCNKNNVQMKFILGKEKKDIYDLKSLGLVLGMPTWMIKNIL